MTLRLLEDDELDWSPLISLGFPQLALSKQKRLRWGRSQGLTGKRSPVAGVGTPGVLQYCQEPNLVLRQQCCKLCPVCHTRGYKSETTTSIWAARGDLPAHPQHLRVPRQKAAKRQPPCASQQ